MKMSNWCAVAGMILLVFCLQWGLKYQMLWQMSYTKQCYNQIADNALEYGLQLGTAEDSSAVPYVNEDVAVSGFQESLLKGFGLSAHSSEGRAMLDSISCIIILQKEYYSVITREGTTRYPYETELGDWKIQFHMDGTVIYNNNKTGQSYERQQENSQNRRTGIVTECIEETLETVLREEIKGRNYKIDFPSVREDACHTLDGIGMLAFLQYVQYDTDGLHCNRFVLSGARVVQKNDSGWTK